MIGGFSTSLARARTSTETVIDTSALHKREQVSTAVAMFNPVFPRGRGRESMLEGKTIRNSANVRRVLGGLIDNFHRLLASGSGDGGGGAAASRDYRDVLSTPPDVDDTAKIIRNKVSHLARGRARESLNLRARANQIA